ncbi:carbohydrate ABC transporter permease [Bacillus sp. FJAT-49732]|uniref:Carbohydrate ABC transporter permease n=1 Tax=Lederbergia citrisecunda TaxID=2833583 RepID=A0A942TQS4_9BACI|nr:carbohydrate ABC transporter permease [Lederbergia citrisecunda]MBS4200544.1 carbohydrate ABC transporter permease [Lederbergia citrisecunda]
MKRRKLLYQIIKYFLVAVLIFFTIAPFLWVFITSISSLKDVTSIPLKWFPSEPNFKNYIKILSAGDGGNDIFSQFRISMYNSFVVAAIVTLVCLVFGSFGAYAFARLNFPFRDKIVVLFLFTQLIPGIAIMLPTYIIFKNLNLLDTKIALILIHTTFTLPFVIWVMRGFFKSIPKDLEDAALIDGTSRFGALFKVILPVSTPGLFATGVFAFLGSWNEFGMALILTSSSQAKTLPVAITEFLGRFTVDFGLMMSGGVLALLPPVLLSLIFQRFLLDGLTTGSIKG